MLKYILPILYTIPYFFLALLVSLIIDSAFPNQTREDVLTLPLWYLTLLCLLQIIIMVIGFMFVVQISYAFMYSIGVDERIDTNVHVIPAAVLCITTVFISAQFSFVVRLAELTRRLRGIDI